MPTERPSDEAVIRELRHCRQAPGMRIRGGPTGAAQDFALARGWLLPAPQEKLSLTASGHKALEAMAERDFGR